MHPLAAVLIALALLVLWDAGWWLAGLKPLGPWTLKTALKRPDPPVVIDVRTPGEYALFHISGAINVPYPAPLNELTGAAPDPSRPVVVVCMTGHRSPPVVRRMRRTGYLAARNLTGGMAAWKLFGGPTVSGR